MMKVTIRRMVVLLVGPGKSGRPPDRVAARATPEMGLIDPFGTPIILQS
jgi:hypothetical protein